MAVAAGRYSTLALDQQGRLYVWGYDGCASGRVLPAAEEMLTPRLVAGALSGLQVVAFDAGVGQLALLMLMLRLMLCLTGTAAAAAATAAAGATAAAAASASAPLMAPCTHPATGYSFWIAAVSDGRVFTCCNQDDGYAGTLPSKRQINLDSELGRGGDPLLPMQVRLFKACHLPQPFCVSQEIAQMYSLPETARERFLSVDSACHDYATAGNLCANIPSILACHLVNIWKQMLDIWSTPGQLILVGSQSVQLCQMEAPQQQATIWYDTVHRCMWGRSLFLLLTGVANPRAWCRSYASSRALCTLTSCRWDQQAPTHIDAPREPCEAAGPHAQLMPPASPARQQAPART